MDVQTDCRELRESVDVASEGYAVEAGPASSTSDTGGLRFDQGALLVIDSSTIPASDGISFWRWLGRASDDPDANARPLSLLADPQRPMLERARSCGP